MLLALVLGGRLLRVANFIPSLILSFWMLLGSEAAAQYVAQSNGSWSGPHADCEISSRAVWDRTGGRTTDVILFVTDSDNDGALNIQVETTLDIPRSEEFPATSARIWSREAPRVRAAIARDVRYGSRRRFWRFSEEQSARMLEVLRNGQAVAVDISYVAMSFRFPSGNFETAMRSAYICRSLN